ncbi:hypothetical protein C8Q76DRAFT_789971 [Earliella scabrosa]|nr:hypothetical protein C8Q76DRAFT_789971 [Earliella scabrosa]
MTRLISHNRLASCIAPTHPRIQVDLRFFAAGNSVDSKSLSASSDPIETATSTTLFSQPTFSQPTFSQPTFLQPTCSQPTFLQPTLPSGSSMPVPTTL